MPQRTHNLISGKDKNTIKSGKYCKKVCTGDQRPQKKNTKVNLAEMDETYTPVWVGRENKSWPSRRGISGQGAETKMWPS